MTSIFYTVMPHICKAAPLPVGYGFLRLSQRIHMANAQHPHIGLNIANCRKAKGKRLKDLSEATGLSIGYLSDIQVGRTDPTVATLYKIAAALGVDPTELMRGEVG